MLPDRRVHVLYDASVCETDMDTLQALVHRHAESSQVAHFTWEGEARQTDDAETGLLD